MCRCIVIHTYAHTQTHAHKDTHTGTHTQKHPTSPPPQQKRYAKGSGAVPREALLGAKGLTHGEKYNYCFQAMVAFH